MYWKRKDDYKLDYTKQWSGDWDFTGYSFPVNMLEIDSSYYYISKDMPTVDLEGMEGNSVRGSGFDDLVKNKDVRYFNLADVNIIEKATKCLFSRISKYNLILF